MINSVPAFSNNSIAKQPNFKGTANFTCQAPEKLGDFISSCANFCDTAARLNIENVKAKGSVSNNIGNFAISCAEKCNKVFSEMSEKFAKRQGYDFDFKA